MATLQKLMMMSTVNLVEKNIYYARKGDFFFFFKVPETLFKTGVVWQPTPVFLPGESQGQGSLVGCCLWGLHIVARD